MQEAYRLKIDVGLQEKRLREINKILESIADFSGKKSATITGQYVKAKISQRENVKWDQSRLTQIKDHFPAVFPEAFKIEWKPTGAKELEMAAASNPDFAKAVDWCRTVTPGAPTVTYEPIGTMEEVQDAA